MLTLKNISASVEKKQILSKIDCNFDTGKVYAIMGPNGSGKSTLASVAMGHPAYTLSKQSKIMFDGEDITDLDPDKRSKRGLFLSFQSPLSLSGVTIYQLLRYALDGKIDPMTARKKIQHYSKALKINEELLSRSLNEGFSGGEKKKMEVLQAAMLNPKLIFFDEIDTGVDVDALRAISSFINTLKKEGKTIVLITHYNRILKYVRPDKVMVLVKGRLVKTGPAKLAETIEKKGYDHLSS